MPTLITMADFLKRTAHFPFRKKTKPGGRWIDKLWDAIGDALTAARDMILRAAAMMHPGTSAGEYADHWGRCLCGLGRFDAESDEDYQTRLGAAGEFWAKVGTNGALTAYLAAAGWQVEVTNHPTRVSARVVTVINGPADLPAAQLVAAIYKFRPAHLTYTIELGGELNYAGPDFCPLGEGEWSGPDDRTVRPAFDYFKRWMED